MINKLIKVYNFKYGYISIELKDNNEIFKGQKLSAFRKSVNKDTNIEIISLDN